jgi:hypothetical protein
MRRLIWDLGVFWLPRRLWFTLRKSDRVKIAARNRRRFDAVFGPGEIGFAT